MIDHLFLAEAFFVGCALPGGAATALADTKAEEGDTPAAAGAPPHRSVRQWRHRRGAGQHRQRPCPTAAEN